MTGGPRTAPAAGPWVAVVGTRPNYVKVAPLARAAAAQGRELLWIHTGQHTAAALTRAMARDLRMASPAKRLRAPAVGEGRRTRLVTSLQRAFEALDAGLVVTVGDVDSTLAAAVAAHASDRPLVHVEAGLRSFDRRMPEERNRVAVDALSDRLYGTEAAALEHLRAEGIPSSRIRTPGNVMADALLQMRPEISAA